MDYRRKSLSQNLGRSPVFVSQIMFPQSCSLPGQGNAHRAVDIFCGIPKSPEVLEHVDERDKVGPVTNKASQDKGDRNKGTQS